MKAVSTAKQQLFELESLGPASLRIGFRIAADPRTTAASNPHNRPPSSSALKVTSRSTLGFSLPRQGTSVRTYNRNIPPMTLGRIAYGLAVIAVFCVLAVFFSHAIQGPYSVVHGPVTALLSLRAAAGVRMAIMHAGLNALAMRVSFALVLVSWVPLWIQDSQADSLPGSGSQVLRC